MSNNEFIIELKRGLRADLPLTDTHIGQPYFCTDTNELFVWNGTVMAAVSGGSSATPGGSNTDIQFNDSGAFGGSAAMFFDKTTNSFTLGAGDDETLGPTAIVSMAVGANGANFLTLDAPDNAVVISAGETGASLAIQADQIVTANAGAEVQFSIGDTPVIDVTTSSFTVTVPGTNPVMMPVANPTLASAPLITDGNNPAQLSYGTPILGTPLLGKIPIGQGDGTAAFADPFVQGVYNPGTNVTTGGLSGGPINPVLMGGSDYAGSPLLHDLKIDSSGQIYLGNSSIAVSGTVAVSSVSGSVAVTGTFYPYSLGQQGNSSSVPVVLTAAQLATLTPLTTVAVTGTFFQTTQPVSLATCVPNVQQALTTSALIKNGAGTFLGFDWFNPNTVPVYVFIYNTTSAPTIGSTTNLIYQKGFPAGAGSNEDFTFAKACSAGIYIAVSTAATSSVAPATGLVLTTSYV